MFTQTGLPATIKDATGIEIAISQFSWKGFAVKLSDEQERTYREKGYLLLPGLFSRAEVAVLEDGMAQVLKRDGPEVARERDGTVHLVYGVHLFDDRLFALSRHPRIVEPCRKLTGGEVFVHQSRVNAKQFHGAMVDWHQDFGIYHRVDGLPASRGIVVAVFLDEVTACNAPVMCLPGSHGEGVIEAAVNPDGEVDQAARYRYDISRDTMARLVERFGVEAVMGPAGSMLLMDGNLVHGSSVNMTPMRRAILYINITDTHNRGAFDRPEYQAARDFSPLESLDDDCLMKWSAPGESEERVCE